MFVINIGITNVNDAPYLIHLSFDTYSSSPHFIDTLSPLAQAISMSD